MDKKELTKMIPSAINKVFEHYESTAELTLDETNRPTIVDKTGIAPSQIIKMILMSDSLGRAQVIIPSDCLLDVDVLNRAVGRTLEALPNEDVSSLIARYNFTELPAIPDITGLPSIIDSRVLANDVIYVESGQPGQLIKLSKEAFSISTQKAKEVSFVVPLNSIQCNPVSVSNDLEEINQAIEKFTSLRIKQRLEDTLELPPLPQSAQDIIKLRSDPDAGSDELADIIERDPSLAAQVVSWASSSFYNAPGKVKSVHDAIVRVLGFDMVMNLAMGLALGRTLKVPDQSKGYLPYWHQAMWIALGTTALISKIEPAYRPSFGLSYLSGLLHNFGYLVLAHVFPPHFMLICRYADANPHVDSAYIEHFLLGITREQVGSQLMSVWNMPEEVTTALRHQKNTVFEGEFSEYSNILNLTHHLLAEAGILTGTGIAIDDGIYARLHIKKDDADAGIAKLLENQEEVAGVAGMMSR
ncbi:MAG: HD-like signal output (HDOD) protein/prolyl-tRNA editing enzyme YbaK/EbsC (Cys-tRNA(Pro) deacylase) [Oleiphilaceae bacterium]|jgi:HD-like signal output (HDOD) protein/prolyl-tRNA editing enzyme YbaK/EbsC (Cys-tRNA(Pro) deacylase)